MQFNGVQVPAYDPIAMIGDPGGAVLPYVPTEWFGAASDGVTDDYRAVVGAIAFAEANDAPRAVQLGPDTLISGTLTLTTASLVGNGGNTGATTLISSALSGPVIHLKGRSITVSGIKIGSTFARRAAVTTTGHGVFIAPDDTPGFVSLSRQRLIDLWIIDQPTDGVHTIGQLEFSRFELVTVMDCLRHGFVMDGGTVAGYTNLALPPFIIHLDQCRAIECGGQALIVQSAGGNAPFGFTADQFEALGCCWDTTKRYLASEYQIYLSGGTGFTLETPDVEDQQYANATTSQGSAKTARATPSKGIYRAGDGTIIRNPYFSSLTESFNQISGTGITIMNPRIFDGTYTTKQNPAIIIASAVKDVDVKWAASSSQATQTLRNQSINARIVADGIPQIGDAFSTFDYSDGLAPVAVTIAANTLTTTNRRTLVAGEGAAADDLSTLRLTSGGNGVTGMDMFLFRGSQDITIKHGVANIRTATAADVVMSATANTVLHFAYDGTNWVQV